MNKVLVFLVLVLSFMTVGCGGKESAELPVTHTAVVCGSRSNSCFASFLNTEPAKEAILESTRSCGSVTLIVADGKPYVAEQFVVEASEKKLSEKKKNQIANKQAEQVLATAKEVKAATEEADLLSALQLAGRSLAEVEGQKQILVIDSGLSTVGKINCLNTELLENGMTEDHFKFLKEEKELPVLDGVTVLWIGLGDTTGQQMPCPAIVREKLMQVWEKVLSEAEAVIFSNALPGNEVQKDLPFVSVVDYPEERVFTPVIFDDERLMFQPDSVELMDRTAAETVLLPMVNELKRTGIQIAIFGTTASVGNNSDCVVFSEARAKTVKDLMVNDMGLPEEQIALVKGLGYENTFHINDRLQDGTLNPMSAQKNRSVIVMSIDDASKDGLV